MESLYLLIPISLLILAGGIGIFFWAVKSGQYDDVDREGERILYDDDEIPAPAKKADASPVKTEDSEND